jgi:hypothetical protein
MKMSDINDGIQIILNRMKSNPEEFFDDGGRWKWIFKEVMREVMTETEKVAIHEQLKQVRRMEITAKAAATILKVDEQQQAESEAYYGNAIAKMEGTPVQPKKLVISAAQAEMIKRMNK